MVEEAPEGLGGKLDFLAHFAALPDPRQSVKVLYRLDGVLLLTRCAVLCGIDGGVSVALFGKRNLAFLRRFPPFANGTPSHDQLDLIFGALDAEGFQSCFVAWTQGLARAVEGVAAIDGKTARRSFDRLVRPRPSHVDQWRERRRPRRDRRHTLEAGAMRIDLFEAPVRPVGAGDAFTIRAGCDKQFATCKAKFANAVNFRGFPWMPGDDVVVRHPNRDDANSGQPLGRRG